ncbi:MAG TPA: hypothetical protein VGD82_04865 [Methylotenera sp.]
MSVFWYTCIVRIVFNSNLNGIGEIMALAIYIGYYLVAITALFFHFTGHLERWGMEWVILVLAATVFPVVLYV